MRRRVRGAVVVPATDRDREVVQSLAGTRDQVGASLARTVVSLGALHLAAVGNAVLGRRHASVPAGPACQLYVASSATRHGARLTTAVVRASADARVPNAVVADDRLADPDVPVDIDFPDLGIRSMVRVVRPRALLRAWGTVRRTGAAGRWSAGYPYRLLAQAVRFYLADEVVGSAGPVVVVDFDRSPYAWPLVRAAQAAGRTAVTLVHGSPSAGSYLPLVADHVFVWGRVQREFFARSSGADVSVVGRPELEVPGPRPTTGERRVIVCESREALSHDEVVRCADAVRCARDAGREVVLRPHPISARLGLRRGSGWDELAAEVDRVSDDGAPLSEVLRCDDEVIVVTSTAGIDALAVGVQVRVLADADRVLPCDLEAVRAWTDQSVLEVRSAVLEAVGPAARANLGKAMRALQGAGPGSG